MPAAPSRTVLAAAVLAAPLLLAGCSGLALPKEARGEPATPRALELAWRTPASTPDWVPADAARIRFVAASTGPADVTPAAVRVATSSALPVTCRTVTRRSLSAFDPAWAPAAYPELVRRCGNWAVVPVEDGWFGWTPAEPPADSDG